MTTVELDISSEGLMDQIMALVAPPRSLESHADDDANSGDSALFRHTSATASGRRGYRHPTLPSGGPASGGVGEDLSSWRKPRANCHDYCDSCRTFEGDRLVCDRCPASFHLECLDPPMDPEEATTGVWFCHRCTMIIKEEDDNASTTSSTTSLVGPSSLSNHQPASTGFRSRGRPKKPGMSLGLRRLDHRFRMLDDSCEPLASKNLLSLDQLIQAARFLNPKEFDLPKDFVPDIKLPGSYKSELERKSKSIIELENSMIPQPTKTCDFCDRTCQHAALLQCSYCPSCFHLDCLDPPLSVFPPRAERWMCPHHAEHLLDDILPSNSIRLSDRMRLQARLPSGPGLSQHRIVSRFFRQIQRRRASALPWRNSTLAAMEEQRKSVYPIKIPAAIKRMYTIPPNRLLRSGDHFELTDEEITRMAIEAEQRNQPASKDDRDLFLHTLLGFHIDSSVMVSTATPALVPHNDSDKSPAAASHNQLPVCPSSQESEESPFTSPSIEAETSHIKNHKRRASLDACEEGVTESPMSKKQVVSPSAYRRRNNGCMTRVSTRTSKKKCILYPGEEPSNDLKVLLTPINVNLATNGAVVSTKKHADKNHISQVIHEKPHLPPCDVPLTVKEQIEQLLESKTDMASCLEDKKLVRLLARDHLASLRSAKSAAAVPCPPPPAHHPSIDAEARAAAQVLASVALEHQRRRQRKRGVTAPLLPPPKQDIDPWERLVCRAVLVPVQGVGPQLRMSYRQLTIGTDPRSRLCLLDFGSCRHVSGHHATIFYDEWTRTFELINYSEHGTLVDGVVYSNDTGAKSAWTPKVSRLVRGVRDVLSTSEGSRERLNCERLPRGQPSQSRVQTFASERTHEAHVMPRNDFICSCVTSHDRSLGEAGWEGTALLHNQSLIQFGCIQFLLCCLDADSPVVMDTRG